MFEQIRELLKEVEEEAKLLSPQFETQEKEVGPDEIVIGTLPPNLILLNKVRDLYRKELVQKAVSALLSRDPLMPGERLIYKEVCITGLFWFLVRTYFNSWDKGIGVRKNDQVITFTSPLEDERR